MIIKTKLISCLDRAFLDNRLEDFEGITTIRGLRGERLSYQLICKVENEASDVCFAQFVLCTPKLSGELAKYATIREVKQVPVEMPVRLDIKDEHYERTAPGLYPDPLFPLPYAGKLIAKAGVPSAYWIDIALPEDAPVGETALTLELYNKDGTEFYTKESITVEVINATLPEQTLMFTQWFHCDCLAQYYRVPVWSEEHWRIIENFASVAVKNGINLLLTPVFTPPLDTEIGGERLTTQLVDITVNGGKYEFGFDKLDRWVAMCDRVGVKYLEISHLFTQWGAKHAPKIMATVDGEYKKIFGWETDAAAEEYIGFLSEFLPALIAHMKKSGNDQRCMFHISDEPHKTQLESYSKAKAAVSPQLKDYVIMDALSDYDFWQLGLVDLPIPCNNHIKPFIENNVPNLWTYYCSAQLKDVSNRLIAMPSCRNRSIGMQMYKYNIVGFLHWGYNFYNSCYSINRVNPYVDSCGEYWVPAGDTYSVYPGENGEALESIRIVVFTEALQDMRAMQLCEKLYSKDEVVAAMEEVLGDKITFDRCAYTAESMLAIREKINDMIKAKVG